MKFTNLYKFMTPIALTLVVSSIIIFSLAGATYGSLVIILFILGIGLAFFSVFLYRSAGEPDIKPYASILDQKKRISMGQCWDHVKWAYLERHGISGTVERVKAKKYHLFAAQRIINTSDLELLDSRLLVLSKQSLAFFHIYVWGGKRQAQQRIIIAPLGEGTESIFPGMNFTDINEIYVPSLDLKKLPIVGPATPIDIMIETLRGLGVEGTREELRRIEELLEFAPKEKIIVREQPKRFSKQVQQPIVEREYEQGEL